jgi:hypothetical protein
MVENFHLCLDSTFILTGWLQTGWRVQKKGKTMIWQTLEWLLALSFAHSCSQAASKLGWTRFLLSSSSEYPKS